MSRVVYRCRVCRELIPWEQECVTCAPRIITRPKGDGTEPQEICFHSKLAAAYHLAKGSQETANDIAVVLSRSTPSMSDEFTHLAANFLRISELLVEAGFRP